jgi:NAD(P)-dependent dehydrogenase (short-subunit alcohol dehydrogenase family)
LHKTRRSQETGGEAISVAADVSKAGDVDAMVRRTVETYGRLDRAFNNAGIEGQVTPTAECTEDNWLRVIAINLMGLCRKRREVAAHVICLSFSCNKLKLTDLGLVAVNRRTGMEINPKEIIPAEIGRAGIKQPSWITPF